MTDQVKRFSEAEMVRLAASGVAKVDLLGPRGTTLCTMDEIEAMAAMIVPPFGEMRWADHRMHPSTWTK